jgi:TRAP-type C4-dicarboxylate transport system permease small subunit
MEPSPPGFLAASPGKPARTPASAAQGVAVGEAAPVPFGTGDAAHAGVELVQGTARNLKWRALDPLERMLMILCGTCLAGFSASTLLDVVARVLGHALLWPQEVTSTFFIYGVFVGAAVATRRNDHLCLSVVTEAMTGRFRLFFEVFNRLVVLLVGLGLVVFGFENFLTGFGSFRMPSMLPIAYLYWPIPLCGALIALFSIEQIVNGLAHGFAPSPSDMPSRGPL